MFDKLTETHLRMALQRIQDALPTLILAEDVDLGPEVGRYANVKYSRFVESKHGYLLTGAYPNIKVQKVRFDFDDPAHE